jgi:hypothetical protein
VAWSLDGRRLAPRHSTARPESATPKRLLRRREADKTFRCAASIKWPGGEFGGDHCEPMPWIEIYADFIVAASEIHDEGVPGTDHPCRAVSDGASYLDVHPRTVIQILRHARAAGWRLSRWQSFNAGVWSTSTPSSGSMARAYQPPQISIDATRLADAIHQAAAHVRLTVKTPTTRPGAALR